MKNLPFNQTNDLLLSVWKSTSEISHLFTKAVVENVKINPTAKEINDFDFYIRNTALQLEIIKTSFKSLLNNSL